MFIGGAFLVGAVRPQLRVLLWAAPSIWLLGHALFHFWEVAVGICSPSDIVRDFPAVTLPAIFGAVLTLWAICYAGAEKSRILVISRQNYDHPTLINPNATETAAAMESNFHMELTSANIDHRSGVVMDRPMKGFLKFFVVIFPGWDFGNPE